MVSGRRILRTVSVFDESIIISSSLMVVNAAAFPLYKTSVHFNAISSPSAKIEVVFKRHLLRTVKMFYLLFSYNFSPIEMDSHTQ